MRQLFDGILASGVAGFLFGGSVIDRFRSGFVCLNLVSRF